jgi:hypothetical protein
MASKKREREWGPEIVAQFVLREGIKARIKAAEEALEWQVLDVIAKELGKEAIWITDLRYAVEEKAEELKATCAVSKVRDALEAAALALAPGGAVATFSRRAVDEVFDGPVGQGEDVAFMRLLLDVRVVGIPVKAKSWNKRVLETVKDTYKEFTFVVDSGVLDGEPLAAMQAAARAAITDLLNRTPMEELLRMGTDHEYDGTDMPPCEFLVSYNVTLFIVFARPEGGWPCAVTRTRWMLGSFKGH